MAVLEVLAMERSFKTSTPILAFGFIEVERPEIRSFQRMMPFESNPRGLIGETRAVTVATTNGVTHNAPFHSVVSHRPQVRGSASFSPNYSFLTCKIGGTSTSSPKGAMVETALRSNVIGTRSAAKSGNKDPTPNAEVSSGAPVPWPSMHDAAKSLIAVLGVSQIRGAQC